jgi:hypothetical protein
MFRTYGNYSNAGNIGAFGKGTVSPAPAPPSSDPDIAEEDVEEDDFEEGPQLPQADEFSVMKPKSDKMASLKTAVAKAKAAKKAKDDKMLAHQIKLRKQAAYGRDTVQARPKQAGYSTEAEKLMGGGTGYYTKPVAAGFGQADLGTRSIEAATRIVNQLSEDVKSGVATKAELAAAVYRLKSMVSAGKGGGLGNFASGKVGCLITVGIIGFVAYAILNR